MPDVTQSTLERSCSHVVASHDQEMQPQDGISPRIQNICCKVGHQHLGVISVFIFGQHSSQSFGIIHIFRDLDFLHFITEEKKENRFSYISHKHFQNTNLWGNVQPGLYRYTKP